ncbi:MAG: hypothetical protein AB1758_09850 [Candidatus Eremiobacterota bacterium]
MLRALIVTLLLLTAPAAAYDPDPEFEKLIFFSVLEGLYDVDLPRETVDLVLSVDPQGNPFSFLPGCPICRPVRQAFQVYRDGLAGTPHGAGAPPELAELGSPEPLRRTSAVARLVRRWVARRLARERWTPAEKQAWAARFEAARLEGLQALSRSQSQGADAYRLMWSCLMCDAAVRAVEPEAP